ncbi:hypothetical protein BpHYR1_040603 [Brachionus plicatilis]|uniref:Uncharacterized protein n=1 Tax=Brachionus plicatilis TaxID=10195 RepID=A0A3M7RZP1_BRAPC|nr:hypothetical protein BpHYR1_040603 [Brachionus plicatilis]
MVCSIVFYNNFTYNFENTLKKYRLTDSNLKAGFETSFQIKLVYQPYLILIKNYIRLIGVKYSSLGVISNENGLKKIKEELKFKRDTNSLREIFFIQRSKNMFKKKKGHNFNGKPLSFSLNLLKSAIYFFKLNS